MPEPQTTSRVPATQRADRSHGGRPRDPTRDAAIRAGALRVLADVGHHGLTMDAVALAAGVGKATIYRRWASKTDLLTDLLTTLCEERPVAPDTGSLRDDLFALLSSLVAVLTGPAGAAHRALVSMLADDPAMAETDSRDAYQRWAEAIAATIGRAVARGEVPSAQGRPLAVEAGPAILIQRWLFGNQPLDASVVAAVVDGVMLPLLRCSRRAP